MMGLFSSFFAGFAGYLEDIYLDSYGFASKSAAYEPEMTEDKAEYRNTHTSKLEKLYTKLAR